MPHHAESAQPASLACGIDAAVSAALFRQGQQLA
jgi:hypothetical protein